MGPGVSRGYINLCRQRGLRETEYYLMLQATEQQIDALEFVFSVIGLEEQ